MGWCPKDRFLQLWWFQLRFGTQKYVGIKIRFWEESHFDKLFTPHFGGAYDLYPLFACSLACCSKVLSEKADWNVCTFIRKRNIRLLMKLWNRLCSVLIVGEGKSTSVCIHNVINVKTAITIKCLVYSFDLKY